MDPISKIRLRSREEWLELLKSYIDDARIWIEGNGVKAAGLGLICGMAFIVFFKLFIFLIVVSGLVGFFIWSVALPDSEFIKRAQSCSAEKDQSTSSSNGPNGHAKDDSDKTH